MEQQNRLGIYWSRQSVTVASLASRGPHPTVTGAFTVRAEADQPPAAMAQAVMDAVRQRGIPVTDCFVAVDAAFYTQHGLHTAFTDYRQIANTIKFDTEEAIATDATNLAITFSVTDTDDTGSSVAVYTSDRAGMMEIVNAILSAGFDPETVEPDILCLARFFQQCFVTPGTMRPLFVVFGEKTCYILSFTDSGHARVRSFVLSASATKTQTLSREIPLTIAAMNTKAAFTGIFIAGSTEGLEPAELSERIGMAVEIVDGVKLTGAGPSVWATGPGRRRIWRPMRRPFPDRGPGGRTSGPTRFPSRVVQGAGEGAANGVRVGGGDPAGDRAEPAGAGVAAQPGGPGPQRQVADGLCPGDEQRYPSDDGKGVQ